MRTGPIILALLACGGGVVAWLSLRGYGGGAGPANASLTAAPIQSSAPPDSGASAGVPAKAAMPGVVASGETARARHSTAASPDAPVEPALADDRARTPKSPAMSDGRLNEDRAARSKVLNALMNSSSLSCDISAAQGANWGGGTARVHDISYGGGPFAYQAINLETGTATMTGSAGITGSVNGELEVKVTPTDTGLNFTGFTRSGDLLIVTIYAAADSAGHYRAVMSRHGHGFANESAQFYGACDTILAQQ